LADLVLDITKNEKKDADNNQMGATSQKMKKYKNAKMKKMLKCKMQKKKKKLEYYYCKD